MVDLDYRSRVNVQAYHSKRGAEVVCRRLETVRGRVDHRDNCHGRPSFGRLVAAGAPVELRPHGKEVSVLDVLGMPGGGLHLTHHELVVGADCLDLALFLLLFDSVVLDVG